MQEEGGEEGGSKLYNCSSFGQQALSDIEDEEEEKEKEEEREEEVVVVQQQQQAARSVLAAAAAEGDVTGVIEAVMRPGGAGVGVGGR